jgi:hypothetical protein
LLAKVSRFSAAMTLRTTASFSAITRTRPSRLGALATALLDGPDAPKLEQPDRERAETAVAIVSQPSGREELCGRRLGVR